MIVVTLSYCFCLFSFCGVTVFCLWQYFLFHYSSYYDITAVQWDPQKRSFDNPMNYIGHAHQTLTRRNWTGSALSTWRSEIDAMHQYQRENSNVISYLFHTTNYNLFTCAKGNLNQDIFSHETLQLWHIQVNLSKYEHSMTHWPTHWRDRRYLIWKVTQSQEDQ